MSDEQEPYEFAPGEWTGGDRRLDDAKREAEIALEKARRSERKAREQ